MTAVSMAWACVGGSSSLEVNPASGGPGSTVTVSGSGFLAPSQDPPVGPVQIRWNSTNGRLMATANGPSFSTAVVIPEDAKARTYYIVAIQRDGDGNIARNSSAAFTVTGAAEPAPPSQPPSGSEQPVGPTDPGRGSSEPASTSAEAPAESAAPAPAATAGTAQRPATAQPVAEAARGRSTAKAGGSGGGEPPGGPPGEGTGQPPAGPSDGAADLAPEAVAVVDAEAFASISSDVWSGFNGAGSSTGPSLTGSPVASRSGDTSGLRLGLALLALGSAGLVGGGLAALRSRRRTVA